MGVIASAIGDFDVMLPIYTHKVESTLVDIEVLQSGECRQQTRVKYEICHSGTVLKTAKLSSPRLDVCDERLAITASPV
jgi:hypothetical protein